MNNSNFVLFRTLLRSTSQWNIFRYCKDKKKKSRVISNFITFGILYLILIAYCIFLCIGYGRMGLAGLLPGICALTISVLAFFFTLFKTNGYLFNFKEYDMLMSLPFRPAAVAGCKFLYMYAKSLPWNMSIAAAILIGYAISVKPSPGIYPVWLVLSLFLPVIPMLAASFLGFIIAKIGSGFKKKSIVQTVLSVLLVLLIFVLRFAFEGIARNEEQMKDVLLSAADKIRNVENVYLPAGWFENSVKDFAVSDMLLLMGLTILLFVVIFIPVGRSYRSINSNLKSHAASKNYKMSSLTRRSILNSIAYKEFKRMTGSATYMTNASLGAIFALIMGIAALFLNISKLLGPVLQDTPISLQVFYPAIPMIVYFFIGMAPSTAMSPSLEGRNYWIVQSLPIEKKTLWQGKMLFNLYLTIPFGLFATICLCISARVPILTVLLNVILMISLCAFSTAWGAVCGIKYMRLDWENEIEVVKQGPAVSIYLLPNMFVTMAIIALMIIMGMKTDPNFVLIVLILIYSALAALSYKKAVSYN